MKKSVLSRGFLSAGLASLLMASVATAAPETFKFDKAHSHIGFRIRHFVSKVEGRFKEYDGVITLDRQNPAASNVELTIQAASIDTGNEGRDKDLRSPNFFDVEKYPTITFKSTKVVPKGNDTYDVTGDFTMHGVTKTIARPAARSFSTASQLTRRRTVPATSSIGRNKDHTSSVAPLPISAALSRARRRTSSGERQIPLWVRFSITRAR